MTTGNPEIRMLCTLSNLWFYHNAFHMQYLVLIKLSHVNKSLNYLQIMIDMEEIMECLNSYKPNIFVGHSLTE